MYLRINPEVKKALEENRPVIALESTIISLNHYFSWDAISAECGNSFENRSNHSRRRSSASYDRYH